MLRNLKLSFAVGLLTMLSACGGGGGSSAPTTTTSAVDFNISSALKNYYLLGFAKNVNLNSQNANNLTGTGTITTSVIPNASATWYSFQTPNCGNVTSVLTKVVQSASIRLNNGQSFSTTSTNHFDSNAKPFLYDDLYVHTYLTPPQAAKVTTGNLLFSATENPRFFVTFPGTCAGTTSYRDITVNWMLDADTASTAILKLTEIEKSQYDKNTSTTYTYLKIQPDGTILSRRYESSASDSQMVLFFE
jgi:hypothetical protein